MSTSTTKRYRCRNCTFRDRSFWVGGLPKKKKPPLCQRQNRSGWATQNSPYGFTVRHPGRSKSRKSPTLCANRKGWATPILPGGLKVRRPPRQRVSENRARLIGSLRKILLVRRGSGGLAFPSAVCSIDAFPSRSRTRYSRRPTRPQDPFAGVRWHPSIP
jgi:hypothetical protein